MVVNKNGRKASSSTVKVAGDRAKLLEECGTKSAAIRKLHKEGWTRAQIAEFLGVRYQHVRTVLITPLVNDA